MPPVFTSPEQIKSQRARGLALTRQAGTAVNPLAAALLGFGGGLTSAGAERRLAENQAITADTLRQIREAPQGDSVSRILLRSQDPNLMSQGLSLREKERQRASDRAFKSAELALKQQDAALKRRLTGAQIEKLEADAAKIRLEAQPGGFASRIRIEEEAKALGKNIATLRKEVNEDGRKAASSLSQLRRFKELNRTATTGFLAGTRLKAGRLLRSFGFDPATLNINPDLSASEAINSLGSLQALNFTQLTKGAISDREFQTFQEAAPGLVNTRDGNRLIIEFFETKALREQEISRRVNALGIGEFDEAVRQQIADQVRSEIPMPSRFGGGQGRGAPTPQPGGGTSVVPTTQIAPDFEPGGVPPQAVPQTRDFGDLSLPDQPQPRFVPGTIIEQSDFADLNEGQAVIDDATGAMFVKQDGEPLQIFTIRGNHYIRRGGEMVQVGRDANGRVVPIRGATSTFVEGGA